MDKTALKHKILTLEGLTNEEKSALLELLNKQKKYGLVWEEKPEDVEERLRDSLPVFKEVKERAIISDSPDAPNHILIEGDNLEALTALSYTHEGKIDVIYIDPPYNTGNKDFIYNDSFVDSEDGYRHSKWLSFMSKRLKIAKRLLSDKGVIFISIDDNEQAQLKLLCDDVFGGNTNFLGQLILKTATDNNATQINTEHEYMLCYCKYRSLQNNWKRTGLAAKLIIEKHKDLLALGISPSEIQKELRKWIKDNKSNLPQVAHYNNVDEKGVYSSSSNSSNPHPGGYMYDIIHPLTGLACPKPRNGWRWPKYTFDEYDKKGEIEWGKDHFTQPHVKKRVETATDYLRTLIYEDNRGTTMSLAEIFNGEKVFDNPKPQKVLQRILDFSTDKQDVILDFFAGSGTTLHATMQLNSEDGGHRQCILVTNNENKICEEVTYERNKRVINGYTTPKGEEVEGLTNNSLRYYKTELLPREKSPRNMRALMAAATELLCIKEDLYEESKRFGRYRTNPKTIRYFEKGNKRMLIIFCEELADQIAEEIKTLDFGGDKLKVYIFSPDRYAFDDNFFEVQDKVTLVALPAAIYDAYRRVLPKRIDKPLLEVVEGETLASPSQQSIDFNFE
ncbi:MAG: site-specific DNA-methyltransferase [Prevotella sp.]|nr:site-specific DNA-methyltransferase [Prevotella sp.]